MGIKGNFANNQRMQAVSFTTVGANTWVVPGGVTRILVDGCGGGGGGAGGQANASTSGGGGGGGGFGVNQYPLDVTPGSTLTIGIGSAGSLGAAGSNGSNGGNSTITGAVSLFPVLYGGAGG